MILRIISNWMNIKSNEKEISFDVLLKDFFFDFL